MSDRTDIKEYNKLIRASNKAVDSLDFLQKSVKYGAGTVSTNVAVSSLVDACIYQQQAIHSAIQIFKTLIPNVVEVDIK